MREEKEEDKESLALEAEAEAAVGRMREVAVVLKAAMVGDDRCGSVRLSDRGSAIWNWMGCPLFICCLSFCCGLDGANGRRRHSDWARLEMGLGLIYGPALVSFGVTCILFWIN